jgi:putative NADH-flavin reductase
MKIIIFGATGGTGKELVQQALEQGYSVTAFVRRKGKLDIEHERLIEVVGDAFKSSDVDSAVANHDAVLSALGLPLFRFSGARICSEGTRNIMNAMKKHGVRRLIVESAYGAGDSRTSIYGFLIWLFVPGRMNDKQRMEKIIKASDYDWTIVRPVALTSGKKSGKYDSHVYWFEPWPMISRADVAEFMLNQLNDTTYVRKAVTLS